MSLVLSARSLSPRATREGFWLVALIVLLAVVFGLLPLGRLVLMALAPGGDLALGPFWAEIASRSATRALLHTLEVGFGSAVLALAIGTAFALLVTVTDVGGKRALAFAFVFSLMVAPQVIALAYLSLTGPASPILALLGLSPAPGTSNPLLGRGGIILVMALHHAPLVAITLWSGLRLVPHSLIEAAALEGASPARITTRIVVPLLRNHLVAAGLLAFVAGVGNFGIPALMGLPVNYVTLPTLIYRRLTSFGPAALSDAATLSLLVALVAGCAAVAGAWLVRGNRAMGRVDIERRMEPYWHLGPARGLVTWLVVLALVAKIGLPFAALLAESLVPALGVPLSAETITLSKYVEVLLTQEVTTRAFRNSFLMAGSAALALGLLAIGLAYGLSRRMGRWRVWVEAAIEVPYALPGVVLAIACILLFLKPLPVLNISLYGTVWIILFAYMARFLAPALKAPLAAMAQIEAHHEDAARLDGASSWQLLRFVVAPILAPAAAAGALLVFLVAFNELTVSALLWSAGTETLGVVLFSLKEAGLAGEAAAVAISASVIILAVMLLLDRLAPSLPDGVLPWRL